MGKPKVERDENGLILEVGHFVHTWERVLRDGSPNRKVTLHTGLSLQLAPCEASTSHEDAACRYVYRAATTGGLTALKARSYSDDETDLSDDMTYNAYHAYQTGPGKTRGGKDRAKTASEVEQEFLSSVRVKTCYCPWCFRSMERFGSDAALPDPRNPGKTMSPEQYFLRHQVALVNGIPLWVNDIDARIDAALEDRPQPPLPKPARILTVREAVRLTACRDWGEGTAVSIPERAAVKVGTDGEFYVSAWVKVDVKFPGGTVPHIDALLPE